MNIIFTRMAGIALAFGLLIGCSSSLSNLHKARVKLDQNKYDEALKAINRQIESNPSNPEAYFIKGSILFGIALNQSAPADRTPYYRKMREALVSARTLYRDSLYTDKAVELKNINDLLRNGWNHEYRAGFRLMKSSKTDTLSSSRENQRAIAHFENATILLPDSLKPYRQQARLYYQAGKTRKAIKTLNTALQKRQYPSASILEQLAFLYLRTGDTQRAIPLYEQALKRSTKRDQNLTHGLIKAYINTGAHQSAIRMLDTLVHNHPRNTSYRLSYASQLYHAASAQLDSISSVNLYEQSESRIPDSASPHKSSSIMENIHWNRADSLYMLARRQYLTVDSLSTKNPEIDYTIALFFKNMGMDYRELASALPPHLSQPAANRETKYLKQAVHYLEEATSIRPDQPLYWKQLHQLYTYFGWQEKAKKARKKAKAL